MVILGVLVFSALLTMFAGIAFVLFGILSSVMAEIIDTIFERI